MGGFTLAEQYIHIILERFDQSILTCLDISL